MAAVAVRTYMCVCVCVCGGGGGRRVSASGSRTQAAFAPSSCHRYTTAFTCHAVSRCKLYRELPVMYPSASYGSRSLVFESVAVSRLVTLSVKY